MDKIVYLYKGKPIRNLDTYFLESGAYIEEFDTDDGHFVLGCDISDYPEDVKREAIRLGVIDLAGNLIPWDGTVVED